MSSFQDRLFKAIQDGCESLYGEFVRICHENLPCDADVRYQWLRNNGYVVRDDADIAVYVHKVAARHQPKFQWLYGNLFQQYPNVFQGELDLVVWGCGCGLDLLALYDRAMKQDNPQLWLTVRSVTLLDISETALSCAKEFAELLFPCARGRIVGHVCDFKDFDSAKVEIPSSFIYTPRLHLISNVLDLLSQEQLAVFVAKQKRCTARKSYFNEMFVAFSPEYRNWDSAASRQKLEAFRSEWGEKATDVSVSGNEPANCAYATFEYNDLLKSNAYRLCASGNRCLRNIVRGRNRCLDEGCDDSCLAHLHQKLALIKIGGRNFFECYEWVDVQKYEKRRGGAVIDRILFVPSKGGVAAPCVICFSRRSPQAPDPKELAWKTLLKTNGLEANEWKHYAEATKVLSWDYKGRRFYETVDIEGHLLGNGEDFSDAFIIDPKGAKPLPSIDKEMDKKQRDIIYGRQELRRIRGGAGCGKTTTMLWHGVLSILRMHQPVLMACRTVTLFMHNQRRMAATILQHIPGLEYVERNLIRFRTIDKYLCEHLMFINECNIAHCGGCKRRFYDILRKDGTLRVPERCKDGVRPTPFCDVIAKYKISPHSIGRDLKEQEKNDACKVCKDRKVSLLCNRDTALLKLADSFGGVLVDEIQSIEPVLVQALYNLTEAGNPNREFYCFCDERQCLESDALENDAEVKRKRVKTPVAGGARRFNSTWITLNKPYRQIGEMSGVLAEVSATFQKVVDDKYGECETEAQPYQPELANAFSVDKVDVHEIANAVIDKVGMLKSIAQDRITVLCDRTREVYQLLRTKDVSFWCSTHAEGASFVEEQRLRNNFEESEDRVGLTTIDLAQGWDFESVILIVTQNNVQSTNTAESVLTGITRAQQQLRIIDASPSGWVYEQLKKFN